MKQTNHCLELIDRLEQNQMLPDADFRALLTCEDESVDAYLTARARAVCDQQFGKEIYIRGLIEISNYCKNDCYYCGIRRSNIQAERYRLSLADILSCCENGYESGFRTFVLQGGEDPYFTDDRMVEIIRAVHGRYPDCAITLSLGEKSKATYQRFYDAGADRYLLRHETADPAHYGRLHPPELTAAQRQQCLYDLREIGFQVGCGLMVGSPDQTPDHIISDLKFMHDLQPHMVGLGPFIPHKDTPFHDRQTGTLGDTLRMLAITRLVLPQVLLPATTALSTIHERGRELGVLAGANVIMPNLSPADVRPKYLLYDDKLCTGAEAAESLSDLKAQMRAVGYEIVTARGDSPLTRAR